MRRAGRREPGPWIKLKQIDPMAGLPGQLLEIEQLATAISLPEGMHIVDIADNFTGGRRENRAAQAAEEILATSRRWTSPMPVSMKRRA